MSLASRRREMARIRRESDVRMRLERRGDNGALTSAVRECLGLRELPQIDKRPRSENRR